MEEEKRVRFPCFSFVFFFFFGNSFEEGSSKFDLKKMWKKEKGSICLAGDEYMY